MIDVLIPSYKSYDDIKGQIEGIYNNTDGLGLVVPSCIRQNAAKNRNFCHSYAKTEYIIMLDDDIKGFYPEWAINLVSPLIRNKDLKFVSARLMKSDGKSFAGMMTSKHKVEGDLEFVPRIPTACFAYRKKEMDELIAFHNDTSLPFDELFEGSGWEDNAICHDMYKRFPSGRIAINNKVKLIHLNEEKEQKKYLLKNKEYFFKTRSEGRED